MSISYWGTPDSNINWCEEDVAVTIYLAEFYNALSSIPIFLFGVFGLWKLKYSFPEKRFALAFLAIAIVGIGSFLFHATLRYWAQWLDELPMLYGNIVCCYIVIEHDKKRKYKHLSAVGTLFGILLTILYLGFPDYYEFFLGFYSLTWLVIIVLSFRRIRELPPKPSSKLLLRVYQFSFLCYLSGVVVWVTENIYCNSLPQWLHFHAFWHILAGMGVFLWLESMLVLRAIRFGKKPGVIVLPLVHVVIDPISK